jgi:two-component sensor histidine kinase
MPFPDDQRLSPNDYGRALLNILDDFAAERDQSRDTQRAISNILDDFADEKDRLALVQKAVLNVLEDLLAEKNELERTKRAVLNILEDLAQEKNRLEESRSEVLRSARALRVSLNEKEVLLREVHHRVKNNLQLIASLLNLQARNLGDERSRTIMEESQSRIHSIALVHETLYQSRELARINLAEYLRTLVRHLLESWIGASGRVRVSVNADEMELPIDAAIPCGLIVNELLTNALKHAFPDERTGSISVSVASDAPGRMRLAVVDDGVGLPEGVEPGKPAGLGLQLVWILTRQLRGTAVVRRRPGTAVELTLEVPA